MLRARVALSRDPRQDREYELPPETRSMIFSFTTGQLGAMAMSDAPFTPGTQHDAVWLTFWDSDVAASTVHAGDDFTVWYGGDIGRGNVLSVGT